jgi:HD-GYP domain-containing protein (c-di-GMP phosphodiesterase class II)
VIEARILAVAEAYHAMTSDHAYRPALTAEQAGNELRRQAGTQFDGSVVEALLSALASAAAGPAA